MIVSRRLLQQYAISVFDCLDIIIDISYIYKQKYQQIGIMNCLKGCMFLSKGENFTFCKLSSSFQFLLYFHFSQCICICINLNYSNSHKSTILYFDEKKFLFCCFMKQNKDLESEKL